MFLYGSAAAALVGCREQRQTNLEVVRFGCLPYGDHTQAVIGAERGLFERAGIDLRFDTLRVEQAIPLLNSGRYDVVSVSPGLLLTAFNDAPDLQMFVYGSLFQGYAIMAQPNSTARTYAEVLRTEPDPAAAARVTIAQMAGKRFAYPPEGGIQPFVDLLFETGGISRRSVRTIVADDPLNVAAMRRGDADFQVGGAPSRITLQKAGFKPIISAVDIARSAQPSPASEALRAVFPDGWAARGDFIRRRPDLILRLSSVCMQINALMRRDPQATSVVHMRYLSQVTGQPFTSADAAIIYRDLDPFLTFEEQARWFTDQSYPLYHRHVIGAHINSFIEDGLYRGRRTPRVEDITVAEGVYRQLSAQGGVTLPGGV
jgi:ABC-type nitrate/sulfonate/bicarbonate transport system substrate-binding protein